MIRFLVVLAIFALVFTGRLLIVGMILLALILETK
jgi:hypothetical protein